MSTTAIVALFLVITLVDGFIFAALIAHLRQSHWKPLENAYPARAPASDAVVRSFQSVRVGLFNLGWCMHLAADEDHMHMTPAAVLRAIGLRPISIPWDEVAVKNASRSGSWVTLRIRNIDVQGPGWCFGLAERQP